MVWIQGDPKSQEDCAQELQWVSKIHFIYKVLLLLVFLLTLAISYSALGAFILYH